MSKFTIKEMCVIAVFAAVTAAVAQVAVPLPFTPVPVALGVFAIFLVGSVLSPRRAVWSQVVYLIVGAAGLPVFARFRGGVDVLLGPTGGYLIAYPIMACTIAWGDRLIARITNRINKKTPVHVLAFANLTLSMLICYAFGTAQLMRVLSVGLPQALAMGVYPYMVFDVVKILVCVVIAPKIKKAISNYIV